ncbi:MAG TPA: bifunctional hydroxymethylpyrimidine kinase/phosphomethylpyrimidine kinase [Limnochordales bacterium]|nr:bifunctional hydroxymethylpyrimidine kinase/phosphomethylpyrimidine kinase [Limnochordales bacterium]
MTYQDRFLSGGGFSHFQGASGGRAAPGGAGPAGQGRRAVPVAMTVAGSDSGGGAGIQADLKTFTAFGVFGVSAITAITAQNTLGVARVDVLDPAMVAEQIGVVLKDIGADAAKTGMLANAAIVRTVVRSLQEHGLTRLVVDPVMVAASGDRLLDPEAVDAVRRELIPHALILTPNIPEAEALTDEPIRSVADMRRAARELVSMGCRWAVVTGGHLAWDPADAPGTEEALAALADPVVTVEPDDGQDGGRDALQAAAGFAASPAIPGRWALDVVYDGRRFTWLKSPFFDTRHTHGTGCTFSAGITAALALGLDPLDAIIAGKRFVTRAIQYALDLGHGHGPTNHLLRFSPAAPGGGVRDGAAG